MRIKKSNTEEKNNKQKSRTKIKKVEKNIEKKIQLMK